MLSIHGDRFPKPAAVTAAHLTEAARLPEHFDWRDVNGEDYVSPVQNQGMFLRFFFESRITELVQTRKKKKSSKVI